MDNVVPTEDTTLAPDYDRSPASSLFPNSGNPTPPFSCLAASPSSSRPLSSNLSRQFSEADLVSSCGGSANGPVLPIPAASLPSGHCLMALLCVNRSGKIAFSFRPFLRIIVIWLSLLLLNNGMTLWFCSPSKMRWLLSRLIQAYLPVGYVTEPGTDQGICNCGASRKWIYCTRLTHTWLG